MSTGIGLAACAADATVILEAGGWRAEVDDALTGDVDLYVDAVTGRTLVIEKFATFRGDDSISPITIVFTQIAADLDTASRIVITDEAVQNLTGLDWNSFQMALAGPATFNQGMSATFSILPFTATSYNGASTQVTYFGGTVVDGATWFPGVASGGLVIDVSLASDDPVTFTFAEIPSTFIPTPGTAACMVLAAGVAGGRRRRLV